MMNRTFPKIWARLYYSAILILIVGTGSVSIAVADPAFSKVTLDITDLSIVAPPPVPGDARDQEDFRILREYQETRTEADCLRSRGAGKINLRSFFGLPYGPLHESEIDRWKGFFNDIEERVHHLSKKAKKVWKRPRPFDVDPAHIKTCGTDPEDSAYPSGHAMMAQIFGHVLSELDPTRQAVFETRARQVGEDRVLAGLHHPTDIEAGRHLGDLAFAALMKDPAFVRELLNAR